MGLEAFSDGYAALSGKRAEVYRKAVDRGASHQEAYAEAGKVSQPERDPMVTLANLTRRFPGAK